MCVNPLVCSRHFPCLSVYGGNKFRWLTSCSCGGLWPLIEAFWPCGQKKKLFMLFMCMLGHFWCSVETYVMFCSNLMEGLTKKNPAYGRHRISWPMQIAAPIFIFPLASKKGLKAFFSFCNVFVYFHVQITNAIVKDSGYWCHREGQPRGGKITSRKNVHFLMYIVIFRVLMPLWRTAGSDAIVKVSLIMWPEGQWEA